MTKISGLVLLLFATPSLAHLVPINPSTCGLTIGFATAGVTAAVDAPTDLVRMSYEPDASPTRSRMQVCPADTVEPATRCGTVVPRGFTVGGASGTIALPSAFDLRMLASGELDATGVPVTIMLGGTPVVVPFDLRTGFVLVGGAPVLGTPLDATGAFRLVGTGTSAALPAPLGGTPLELVLACTLAPVPDLDQFALAPRLDKVRGTLKNGKAKLTIMLDSEFAMSEDASAPTILRLSNAGATLVGLAVPMQSGPRGRLVSSDGSVTIIPLKRATERVQKVVLKGPLATGAIVGTGDGDLALSVGGLMARRGVALKANRHGTKAGVREQ
jgi:hypothetical protein